MSGLGRRSVGGEDARFDRTLGSTRSCVTCAIEKPRSARSMLLPVVSTTGPNPVAVGAAAITRFFVVGGDKDTLP